MKQSLNHNEVKDILKKGKRAVSRGITIIYTDGGAGRGGKGGSVGRGETGRDGKDGGGVGRGGKGGGGMNQGGGKGGGTIALRGTRGAKTRFAVVISKKRVRKSTRRNRIRRILREHLRRAQLPHPRFVLLYTEGERTDDEIRDMAHRAVQNILQ